MTNLEITHDELTTLVGDEFELRLTYSGRAMYGRECLGVVGGVGDYGRFVAAIAQELGTCDASDDDSDWSRGDHLRDILTRITNRVCTDAMGHDTIFYFPVIKVMSTT